MSTGTEEPVLPSPRGWEQNDGGQARGIGIGVTDLETEVTRAYPESIEPKVLYVSSLFLTLS